MSIIRINIAAILIFFSGSLYSCSSKNIASEKTEKTNDEKQELIMQKNPGQRNNLFSFDLMKMLNMSENNTVISPFSINTALAMTYAGAREQTMSQISEVMYYLLDHEKFHPEFKSYSDAIKSLSTKNAGFEIANAIYAQEDYTFLQEFFDIVIENYGSILEYVDFNKGDREAIRQDINEWVEKQTNNKIKELIKPTVLTEDTRMVLINAIYFLAEWAKEFDKDKSYEDNFFKTKEDLSTANFMKASDNFLYYSDEHCSAISIPYNENNFSMLVVLPEKSNNLNSFIKSFNNKYYENIIAGLSKQEVELHLPSFKIKTDTELQQILSNMGMPLAFSDRADFSGMTGKKDLKIDRVIHQAYIEVDEKGTEAAAATAVVMIRKTAIMEPEEKIIFKANRPFLFFIKDTNKNSVIFMGSVIDPSI